VIVFDNDRVCKAGLSGIVAKALNWKNSVHVQSSQNNGYVTSATIKKVYIAQMSQTYSEVSARIFSVTGCRNMYVYVYVCMYVYIYILTAKF
jgi:hypothetical protein